MLFGFHLLSQSGVKFVLEAEISKSCHVENCSLLVENFQTREKMFAFFEQNVGVVEHYKGP